MDFKTINELATEVHKNAVAKGFWEGNPSDEHCLCLVISELMEAVEADRKGSLHYKKKYYPKMEVNEEWRDVWDYKDYYQVSNLGRVRSKDTKVWNGKTMRISKGRILSPGLSGTGYLTCSLKGKTRKVSIMVATAFLLKKNSLDVVNHIDGNKQNDNIGNLEFISFGQNNRHAILSGLKKPFRKIPYELNVEISFRIKYGKEGCLSIYEDIKNRSDISLSAVKVLKQRGDYLKYTDSVEFELADAFIRLLDLAGAREYDLDYCHHLDVVTPKRTFTENVYAIIQEVVKEGYTTFGHVLHSIQNIIKLAEILGFDLEYHVRLKMRYNALREYKHGKAY